MRNAIISIEDERFYENAGVDLRGIGRAFFQDVVKGGSRQGGSTITQQFVKNALEAQDQRTVFQKLRESALAYHLTRTWSKNKILTRVPELDLLRQRRLRHRVGRARRTSAPTPTTPAAARRRGRARRSSTAAEAALLAGVVANPSAFDPVAHPEAATRRRNIVLREDARAGQDHARRVRRRHRSRRCPRNDRRRRASTRRRRTSRPGSASSSSSSFGARRAFEGGLRVHTTLDLDLQNAAAAARSTTRSPNPDGPAAAHGRDRQPDRRGPRAGRQHELPRPAVQPRHAGPAPAGLDGQAVHPRRGA